MKKPLYIRLDLEGVEKNRFQTIKQYYGARSNTDCLRMLISEKYRQIKKELGDALDEHSPPG